MVPGLWVREWTDDLNEKGKPLADTWAVREHNLLVKEFKRLQTRYNELVMEGRDE